MRIVSEAFLDDLQYSPEYSEYILENCRGDCPICNGDTLLEAQEDGYLFEEFLESMDIAGVSP